MDGKRETGEPKRKASVSTTLTKPIEAENPTEPAESVAPEPPVHVRKEVAKAAGLSEGTIRKVKVVMGKLPGAGRRNPPPADDSE